MVTHSRSLIEREVDRQFNELGATHGMIERNPITDGNFVWSIDPISEQKKEAARLLLVREWFAVHGPHDAPPLPLSQWECDDYRNSTGLRQIVGFYARSLDANDYDVHRHPSFEDFARGLMASNSGLWGIEKNVEMRKRFPPRPLNGMGPGLYWEAPSKRKPFAVTLHQRLSQRK